MKAMNEKMNKWIKLKPQYKMFLEENKISHNVRKRTFGQERLAKIQISLKAHSLLMAHFE